MARAPFTAGARTLPLPLYPFHQHLTALVPSRKLRLPASCADTPQQSLRALCASTAAAGNADSCVAAIGIKPSMTKAISDYGQGRKLALGAAPDPELLADPILPLKELE